MERGMSFFGGGERLDITEDQAASIREYFQALNTKLDKRRRYNEVPRGFTSHVLETFNSTSSVLMAVDQCTSGRFAYVQVTYDGNMRDVIAFEDPADMTMFLMTYQPTENFRLRVVD